MALERRTYTAPSSQAASPHGGLYITRACMIAAKFMVQAWSAMTSRRVVVVSVEASDVSQGGTATGSDLGGSSNYSSENFEGRGGDGFHGNSNWPWVSRS
ncbi:unnamed protein product [Rodentolepis nana]|uniref:Uncharacterized protein n=1 Tax=Rodentolepis nana TaxID=102285 RepID=A0A0R3T4H0_RODNA|nr:unnamed protein product [Rodentolepis nana]